MHPHLNQAKEKEVLNKALINAAQYLALKQNELHEIVGISTAQLSRLFKSGVECVVPDTKEWECALLFLRLIRSLDTLLGEDEQQCQAWFKSHNYHLGEKPIEMAKRIEGLITIVNYLDAMRGLA